MKSQIKRVLFLSFISLAFTSITSAEENHPAGVFTVEMRSDAQSVAVMEPTHLARGFLMAQQESNPGRDFLATTSSIESSRHKDALIPENYPAEAFQCAAIEVPPAALSTRSKYQQDDSTKSSLDEDAAAERDKVVRPIRRSVRALALLASDIDVSIATNRSRAECLLGHLDRWAAAGSLTQMRSTDAYLTRDRWIAEIVLALRTASKAVAVSEPRQEMYRRWLTSIAQDTIEAYTLRLGPKSRMNNHRYWAGLAVAATGFYLNDAALKDWGKRSFDIGACQVDASGYLPAELERGKKALEYHVYALRPLAAIAKLSAEEHEPLTSPCLEGFKRLTAQTVNSLSDSSAIEAEIGQRQTFNVQESSYSPALRLVRLDIGKI